MVWKADGEKGGENQKAKFAIVRYTRGAGMEIGCGAAKAFPHFIGVDFEADPNGVKPDLVHDLSTIGEVAKPESSDFIYSAHRLQRLRDPLAALNNWWGCLKAGGYLCLYLPHPDLRAEPDPFDRHQLRPNDVKRMMMDVGSWDMVVNEPRSGGEEFSFLQVYEKKEEKEDDFYATFEFSCDRPRPPKTACIVRHGGYGDQLQAAFLFPELKRQGYHITVLTTPKGRDVIEHDPHIDEWFLIAKDQVPHSELVPFWREVKTKYDKFINLNEAVEGTFLAMPGRANHQWPHALRHRLLNHNYAQFAAELAEVPFVAEGAFYPTAEENDWVKQQIGEWSKLVTDSESLKIMGTQLQRPFLILYALSGSSAHKYSPHQDTVLRAIMGTLKRAVVVLAGDQACKILELGWELEPRVVRMSGELSIRQTLALAKKADLVLGPETGVLNSVAYDEKVAKVVLLSHSSRENLTKHWLNTTAVTGVAPCYPCHQLHYTTEFCHVDPETGAAMCQKDMDPMDILRPILFEYEGWAKVHMLRHAA